MCNSCWAMLLDSNRSSLVYISITKLPYVLSSLWIWGCALSWATSQRSLGALAGSIWPRLARSGCPWRPGWLELALLGALAGSIWLPWSLLGALTGSIWLLTNAPTTRLAKKTICLSTTCLDAACLARSATMLHASNLILKIFVCKNEWLVVNSMAN